MKYLVTLFMFMFSLNSFANCKPENILFKGSVPSKNEVYQFCDLTDKIEFTIFKNNKILVREYGKPSDMYRFYDVDENNLSYQGYSLITYNKSGTQKRQHVVEVVNTPAGEMSGYQIYISNPEMPDSEQELILNMIKDVRKTRFKDLP